MHQAGGDADVLMVKTAVACSDEQDTILIGDDTDLFVLLCFHANDAQYNVYFQTRAQGTIPKAIEMLEHQSNPSTAWWQYM